MASGQSPTASFLLKVSADYFIFASGGSKEVLTIFCNDGQQMACEEIETVRILLAEDDAMTAPASR